MVIVDTGRRVVVASVEINRSFMDKHRRIGGVMVSDNGVSLSYHKDELFFAYPYLKNHSKKDLLAANVAASTAQPGGGCVHFGAIANAQLPISDQFCVINHAKTIKVMTQKTTSTIYWTGAALTSLWFGASGFFELTKNPVVWDITVQLGYPAHFIYLLGVFKLSGVAVLLTPNKLHRLKEWVFAGIFFDIIFAFVSKLAVIGFAATADAIIAFVMVSVTYAMFRRLEKYSGNTLDQANVLAH
jgi:hypothetical protein